jgi:uncharacterized protein
MSGPLAADDAATMIGRRFVLDAPDCASLERFHAADPFKSAGIWETVSITGFIRRQG